MYLIIGSQIKTFELNYLKNHKIYIPRVTKFNMVIAPLCLRVRKRRVDQKSKKTPITYHEKRYNMGDHTILVYL